MTYCDACMHSDDALTLVYPLYEQGMDITDIAKTLEVSPIAVKKIIKNNDYKFKRDGKFKEAITEACEDFGISKAFAVRLYKTLRRNGVVIVANGREMVRAHKLTDKQLLSIDGIGVKSVKIIRRAYEI